MKPGKAVSPPIMDLVAGPQGSGKSTFFPVDQSGYDSFNIDEKRKNLNKGSSQNIPAAVQKQAILAYETFIEKHIRAKTSFSIEVTLAKEVTFEQSAKARKVGFSIRLTYVAAELEDCIERVANRLDLGGHGVKVGVLEKTHAVSMGNIVRALREFDIVQVYDNTRRAQLDDNEKESQPRFVLEAQQGTITYRAPDPPDWLRKALKGTEYDN